ncbi:MAG TPA: hypothetical protein VLA19_30705 [Herpetosiphonaceae bacterium]|nr:hypothetical protein [Herpetosiphonaceae bacterium]
MTTTDYKTILREARQLPLEERRRLAGALIDTDEDAATGPTDSTLVASLLALEPLEPAVWDEMERLIEEGCQQVDPHDW